MINEDYIKYMRKFVCPAENVIRKNMRDKKAEMKKGCTKKEANEIDKMFKEIFGCAFEKDCKIEKLEGKHER